MYSESHFQVVMQRKKDQCGSWEAWGRQLGLRGAVLQDMAAGRRAVSPAVRDQLGLRKVTIWVPAGMSDAELEIRLAWARKAQSPPRVRANPANGAGENAAADVPADAAGGVVDRDAGDAGAAGPLGDALSG